MEISKQHMAIDCWYDVEMCYLDVGMCFFDVGMCFLDVEVQDYVMTFG